MMLTIVFKKSLKLVEKENIPMYPELRSYGQLALSSWTTRPIVAGEAVSLQIRLFRKIRAPCRKEH